MSITPITPIDLPEALEPSWFEVIFNGDHDVITSMTWNFELSNHRNEGVKRITITDYEKGPSKLTLKNGFYDPNVTSAVIVYFLVMKRHDYRRKKSIIPKWGSWNDALLFRLFVLSSN